MRSLPQERTGSGATSGWKSALRRFSPAGTIAPIVLALWALMAAACADAGPAAALQPQATGDAPTRVASATPVPATEAAVSMPSLPTPLPTSTALPTATTNPTATPAPTATPDPYAGLTIADLAERSYGEGQLQAEETIHVTESFTRTLISYPSDGHKVLGFLNVPFGPGPFPVALVLHGYIPPEQYGTIGYTTRYADALARAGYLVLHPNYRNHPPLEDAEVSQNGARRPEFRVDYAIDVMNLIALVRKQAARPGPLLRANSQELHLLGHSMGGGIALRVSVVDPEIDAAVLYGSMSGDEYKNYERILEWSEGERGEAELATAPEDMQRIAPINHLQSIQAAISIHHGQEDEQVPPEWSVDLCQRLRDLNKTVECFIYPGAPHSFHDETDRLFQQRVIDFFQRY